MPGPAAAAAAAAATAAQAHTDAYRAVAIKVATGLAPEDDKAIEVFIEVWKAAFGDPRRLNIFRWIIREGPKSVGDIVAKFKAPQPNISQHLSVLRKAKLVTVTRDNQRKMYSATLKPK